MCYEVLNHLVMHLNGSYIQSYNLKLSVQIIRMDVLLLTPTLYFSSLLLSQLQSDNTSQSDIKTVEETETVSSNGIMERGRQQERQVLPWNVIVKVLSNNICLKYVHNYF